MDLAPVTNHVILSTVGLGGRGRKQKGFVFVNALRQYCPKEIAQLVRLSNQESLFAYSLRW